LRLERPQSFPEVEDKLKYVREIRPRLPSNWRRKLKQILKANELPLILGGDHSIAIGSFAGVASHYKKQDNLGLIWFDAHADINTPKPLRRATFTACLWQRCSVMARVNSRTSPALRPSSIRQLCAHVGARDIDAGEKEMIRNSGSVSFTMREIDERGMSAAWTSDRIASRGTAGYAVTFDVDVLDPGMLPDRERSFAAGSRIAKRISRWKRLPKHGGMRSLEIVEINTALDVNNKTAELGVELILSALGKTIL
jgi:arginase